MQGQGARRTRAAARVIDVEDSQEAFIAGLIVDQFKLYVAAIVVAAGRVGVQLQGDVRVVGVNVGRAEIDVAGAVIVAGFGVDRASRRCSAADFQAARCELDVAAICGQVRIQDRLAVGSAGDANFLASRAGFCRVQVRIDQQIGITVDDELHVFVKA